MGEFTLLYGGLALCIGLYGWLWHTRRTALGVLVLLGLFVASYALSAEFLGRPKPVDIEVSFVRSEVLWASIQPGVGIFLVLEGPVLYRLDWDYELAKDLQRKRGEMRPGDSLVFEGGPFMPGVFHRSPQPELPPKYGSE